jgi:hypothetical protein
MTRQRSGKLTDAETLAAYDGGQTVGMLAASEGVTPQAIYTRMSRARRRGDRWPTDHRMTRQRPAQRVKHAGVVHAGHPSLAGLRRAVADLEQAEKERAR